jgi:hypothetical protein
MSEPSAAEREFRYLLTTAAIRERAREVLARVEAGESPHFRFDAARLSEVTERVLRVTRTEYPDPTRIPYHSRFRHFDVGGVPRNRMFAERIAHESLDEQLALRTELVVTSVLLDAGAGPAWRFHERGGGTYTRSEGLAVASYHLFLDGGLSSDRRRPCADADGLAAFDGTALRQAFQVTDENPLAGGDGRAELLRRLGQVVAEAPTYFGKEAPRLGNLGLHLLQRAEGGRLAANAVLGVVLDALSPIWPGRERLAGRNLGDVWRHSELGLIPFHKLSQWLSYSLLEALEARGVVIEGTDELTGLAEYRNGGLFVDAGVLTPRSASATEKIHAMDSDFVIEWRALTILLLDRVADSVRSALGLARSELPLARVLEGGTWRAGRAMALELRADGSPPFKLHSDGTVF